jgi:hypothetical protein
MGTLTIDPKETESFLLTQEDVLDASVWLDSGRLRAHVTPAPGSHLDEKHLREACESNLGARKTPVRIELIAPAQAN